MAIQSDENGFLVGQTVDDIKRANKNTTAILKEVKDIKKLLSGIRSQQNQGQNQQRGQGQPPQPPQPDTQPPRPRQSRSNNNDSSNESSNNQRVNNRSEQVNNQRVNNQRVNNANNEQVNNQQSNNANNEQLNNASEQQPTVNNTSNNDATQNVNNSGNSGTINTDAPVRQETVEPNDFATPRLRDANGRFIRNGEQGTAEPSTGRRRNSRGQFSSGDDSDKDTKGGSSLSGLFDGLGDRIATAIDAGNDLQEADPTVKAFQETVEPMAKGYRFVFGSGSAKDKPYFVWFKRIWRTLKNTEENTEEANRLNGGSILGGLLTAAILAFGVFSKDGKEFFGNLKEKFVDPYIEQIKEKSGYNTVKKGYDTAVDWTSSNIIEPIMDNPGQAFIDSINAVGQATIDYVLEPLGLVPLIESVFQYLKTDWDLFIAQVTATWNIMSTTISEMFKVISVALTGSWDKIVSIGIATFDYFSKSFSSFLKNALSYILDGVAGMLGGLSNFLKDKFGIDISSTVSGITDKAAEMRQSADSAAIEAQSSKQVLNDKANALTQPIADQLAIANQKIAETIEAENKKVSEAADRKSKATEETVKAIGNYTDQLVGLTKKIGGGVVDAVISPASANETPYGGNTVLAGQAKVSGKQEDMMKSVYSSFVNAGFSENQAKALTAEVGRENAYNPNTVFGSHTDAANGATNTGFFSWQGSRSTALRKRLAEKGLLDRSGNIVRSQEALNEQAKFAKEEMESGNYKGLGNFMENKNVDADTAAKQLGKGYIKWAYGQDVLRNGTKFDWRSHDKRRAGYYNKLGTLIGNGENTTPALVTANTDQKTIIATPEQAEKVMPKPQSSVITAQANAVQPTMPNVTPKQPKIPEQPALVLPMATGAKQAQQPQFLTDIGQDLSDSRLAQIAAPYNGFRAK